MSERNRSTMRWRRIDAAASRRPAFVSSTPRYGLWSSRPRPARRLTVAVAVPGDTPRWAASSPVWAPSPSLASRKTALSVSRSDLDRAPSMASAGRNLLFGGRKMQPQPPPRRPLLLVDGEEAVVGVEDGQAACVVADHALDDHAGARADAGDVAAAEEHDADAAGLVDQRALERRYARPRLHPQRPDPARHLGAA